MAVEDTSLRELLSERNYSEIREVLSQYPVPDIADMLLEVDRSDRIILFRLLPRMLSSEVFSYLKSEDQNELLKALSQEETRNLLVNLRYLLFATSMVPHLKNVPPSLATLLSYGLTDETYAVAMTRYQNHEATASYMAGLNITSHIGWISSSLGGAILGTFISNTDKIGLNFALPAIYICLLVFVVGKRSDALVAGISAISCLLLGYVFPSTMANMSNIIIATIIAATLGVIIDERY